MAGDSFLGALLPALAGQLPAMLVELGFAVALLVMLLVQVAKLGRARGVALAGAGLLISVALVSRAVFAGVQAATVTGGLDPGSIGMVYAAVGTVFQVLHGVAIVLLGLAVIRR